ncbi:hypothetical protein [Olivibacter jilunii]|uniref:hypothetical protein n=1 Tax=Olivibacter jilunii TaxID=985016 RepID=UPI001030DB08|nr:hypothetical protein [Olivibacter jilunii]
MEFLAKYSWTEYFMAVAAITIIYYVLVGLKYYGKELLAGAGTKRVPIKSTAAIGEDEPIEEPFGPAVTTPEVYQPVEEVPFEDTPDESFREVERLTGELKVLIEEAAKKMFDKRKLLGALKPLLAKYPVVNHPAFREAVDEYIVTECRSKGAVVLTEDEVEVLWGNER